LGKGGYSWGQLTAAWDEGPLGVGSSPVGVIPTEDWRNGADGVLCGRSHCLQPIGEPLRWMNIGPP